MPYTSAPHDQPVNADELRARIPGWGADLDPSNRPSVPRERHEPTGAHWTLPEQQPELVPRERSIEHARLTPVFGTVAPLKGLSGKIRALAYARYSEGRAAHWLLLLGADRVDAIESHVMSLVSGHPDEPITQSGVLGEKGRRPLGSRFGRGRADTKHTWMDPILVAGPWVVAAGVAFVGVRAVLRLARR